PDARPDRRGAVLEARAMELVRGAKWTIDAGDHAGPGDHAGQRPGEKGALIVAKDKRGQVGWRQWRGDRVDEDEARGGVGPRGVDDGVGQQETARDHQVVSRVGLQKIAILGGTIRDGDVRAGAVQAAQAVLHASPASRISARIETSDV